MTVFMVQPPLDGTHNTLTVNGRMYTSTPGVGIPVIQHDAAVLMANGWTTVISSTDGEADTPPNLGDFTWTNQSGATAVQRNAYISMMTTDSPAGDTMRLLTTPAPAAPYTVTARMRGLQSLNYQGYGIQMVDSASGQFINLGNTGAGFHVSYWTAPTTFSSSWVTGNVIQPAWFRMRDDGTSLWADISMDGYSFVNVWTITRASSPLPHVPDRVGFYLMNNGNPSQCSLHSWKVG